MTRKPTTVMERIDMRLSSVEKIIEQLAPKELMKRVSMLEENLYSNKEVFNTEEACAYLGISESLLYKMTANREIPHYKPRGKNIFFSKEELDAWLLQHYEPTVDEVMSNAEQAAEVQPFYGQKRYGRRKREE